MGISNYRDVPRAAQLRRSAVNSRMGRRGIVAAASQNHRESNHGESGKGGPFWGGNPGMLARPEAISRGFGTESRHFQITALC